MIVGGLVPLLVALLLLPAGQTREAEVRFEWGIWARTGPTDHPVSMGSRTTLKSGDQVKMFLRLKQRGFVYVVLHDADNQLSLLYPAAPSSGEPSIGVAAYIPAGDAWMQLDERLGVETIHLIAAPMRLDGLEAALKRYAAATSSDRGAAARQVLDEIARLKAQFQPGAAPTERPVEIAGTVRGMPPDIAARAVEVSARRFYSRTITIDHR